MPAAHRSGRRDWPWALVVMLAAAALGLLIVRGLPGSSPAPGPVERADTAGSLGGPGPETSVLEGPDAPTAELLVAPPATAPDPDAAPGRLRVQVLSELGGAPLKGARVEAYEDPTDLPPDLEGVPLTGLLHSVAEADAEGRAVLEPPGAEGALRVLAFAPGHRVGEARFSALPSGEVRLTLKRGLAIEGRLYDRQGRPLPGVDLRADHVLRPDLPDRRLLAGAERVEVASGPDGAFRFEGLSPGLYRVDAQTAGWRLLPGGQAPPPGTFSARSTVPVNAGAAGLRLVAAAEAWIRVELREPEEGPLWTTDWSLTARVLATGQPLALHGTQQPEEPGAGLGEVLAPVLLNAPEEAAQGADVGLRVPGYQPAKARVALLADPRGAPEVLTLVPEARGAWVTFGDPHPFALAPFTSGGHGVRVSACLLAAQRLVRRSAGQTGVGNGVWRAGPFPPGESDVRVWLDGVLSEPLRVTLKAGETTPIAPAFPPPTGAAVRLSDRFGRRVFDADSLVFAPEGQARGMADHARATALPFATRDGFRQELLVPLPPGTYRWAAWKQGVGYATGSVTVAPGAVARVTARLDPDGYEAAVRRLAPR